jgi:hypothetical protein
MTPEQTAALGALDRAVAAEATAANRAYLDAAGWALDRGQWSDPDPDPGQAVAWYPDTPAGVARAAFVERARWAVP